MLSPYVSWNMPCSPERNNPLCPHQLDSCTSLSMVQTLLTAIIFCYCALGLLITTSSDCVSPLPTQASEDYRSVIARQEEYVLRNFCAHLNQLQEQLHPAKFTQLQSELSQINRATSLFIIQAELRQAQSACQSAKGLPPNVARSRRSARYDLWHYSYAVISPVLSGRSYKVETHSRERVFCCTTSAEIHRHFNSTGFSQTWLPISPH